MSCYRCRWAIIYLQTRTHDAKPVIDQPSITLYVCSIRVSVRYGQALLVSETHHADNYVIISLRVSNILACNIPEYAHVQYTQICAHPIYSNTLACNISEYTRKQYTQIYSHPIYLNILVCNIPEYNRMQYTRINSHAIYPNIPACDVPEYTRMR